MVIDMTWPLIMWIIVLPRTMISICCHSPSSPRCGLTPAFASPGNLPSRILQLPGSSMPIVPGAVMMLRPALHRAGRCRGCPSPCRTGSRSPAMDCPSAVAPGALPRPAGGAAGFRFPTSPTHGFGAGAGARRTVADRCAAAARLAAAPPAVAPALRRRTGRPPGPPAPPPRAAGAAMRPASMASGYRRDVRREGLPSGSAIDPPCGGCSRRLRYWMPPFAPVADSFTSTFSVKSRMTAPGPV